MNFWNNIFTTVNNLAYKNQILDFIMLFISKKLPYIMLGMVVILYLIGILNKNKKARGIAVDTVVFTVINLILSVILGHFFYASRPFVKDPKANLLYYHKADSSFPSGHSVGSLSIALGLTRYNKFLGIISIILSLLIGFSRLYVGHHYPQHVLASFLIVIILNIFYVKFLSKKVQKIYFTIEKHMPILKNLVYAK